MGKVVLLTGGSRSGKSQVASTMAKRISDRILFIATCLARDKEMRDRIRRHKAARPKHWLTLEEETNIPKRLTEIKGGAQGIILDCLTIYISNLLLNGLKEGQIISHIKLLLAELAKTNSTCIIVTNEVGSGIVPDNPLARRFRDIQGEANQLIAQAADEVYWVTCGIPLRIK